MLPVATSDPAELHMSSCNVALSCHTALMVLGSYVVSPLGPEGAVAGCCAALAKQGNLPSPPAGLEYHRLCPFLICV